MMSLFLFCTGCVSQKRGDLPLGSRIRNAEELIRGIRAGLKGHAASITIRFDYGSDISDELHAAVTDWVEAALEETEDPAEGDYIRYQYGGYTYKTQHRKQGGRWYYTVILIPDYYTYLKQEEGIRTTTCPPLHMRLSYRGPRPARDIVPRFIVSCGRKASGAGS